MPVVCRAIAGLDRSPVPLAQRGCAADRIVFDLVLRRESANANDWWEADHTQLDVMVAGVDADDQDGPRHRDRDLAAEVQRFYLARRTAPPRSSPTTCTPSGPPASCARRWRSGRRPTWPSS